MRALTTTVLRLLALVGKELVSVVRRPGALLSLVLGPFLIMALFGAGFSGYRRPLDAILVIPPQAGLSTDPQVYQDVAGESMHIDSITADEASAMAQLNSQQVDVVIVAPGDIKDRFQAGQKTTIGLRINITDPVESSYATFVARGLEGAINRQIIQEAAAQSEGYAVNQGAAQAKNVPPDVV